MSDWLNPKDIRLFVTTTPAEYASIAAPDSPYVFSEREVLLSGLPRHDALLVRAAETSAKTILIVPTWRKYLTDETNCASMALQRRKITGFAETDYARNWASVLHHPRLHELARREGLQVVFALHPNFAMYLDEFHLPDFVETVDVRLGASYQGLLASARVALTDFSSAISDVAYLDRPVIYFQFDEDEIFAGNHICKQGYFDFRRDGFGPVEVHAG